jgi:hypothetical protein
LALWRQTQRNRRTLRFLPPKRQALSVRRHKTTLMKIEIDITRQDYLNFNLFHFRKKSLVRTGIIGLIGLIILQYEINKEKESVSIIAVLISSIIYILIFSLIMYFSLVRSKSVPKDNGSFLGEKLYDFGDDHISFSDKDSDGRFQWHAIKSLAEDSKAFYLYLDTIMALVIPKRYFVDKFQENAFRNYVQSKLNVA